MRTFLSALAFAATASPNINAAPWDLPPIKTGTQKYRGPGRRLPKHLIGARAATRRHEAFLKAHHHTIA